jgi:hypothetical protein
MRLGRRGDIGAALTVARTFAASKLAILGTHRIRAAGRHRCGGSREGPLKCIWAIVLARPSGSLELVKGRFVQPDLEAAFRASVCVEQAPCRRGGKCRNSRVLVVPYFSHRSVSFLHGGCIASLSNDFGVLTGVTVGPLKHQPGGAYTRREQCVR